jgi:hypothetical protein
MEPSPGSRPRTRGPRPSMLDACALVAAPATVPLWRRIGAITGAMPLAVGHCSLFCNVVRVHRAKESWWDAICIGSVGAWLAEDRLWWPGILARRINPRLDEHLAHRSQALAGAPVAIRRQPAAPPAPISRAERRTRGAIQCTIAHGVLFRT